MDVGTEPSSDADSDLFGLDWGDDSTTTINSVTERNDGTRGGKELVSFVDRKTPARHSGVADCLLASPDTSQQVAPLCGSFSCSRSSMNLWEQWRPVRRGLQLN